MVPAALRQWLFPRGFRISVPALPGDAAIRLAESAEALRALIEHGNRTDADRFEPSSLSEVATGLWRLRRKMVRPDSDEPLDTMARAFRHLESTWDALRQGGVEIQDHTNDRFDSGQSLKVLAFEPSDGIAEERVVETVKPTVYFRGEIVQMGEVIVATPRANKMND